MQPMRVTNSSSTFRDLQPTLNANYGSTSHINPFTGQPSPLSSAYSCSTSASRQAHETVSLLDKPLPQTSSTGSLARYRQQSQGLRSISVDRRSTPVSSTVNKSRQQTPEPITRFHLTHKATSSSLHMPSRPTRLAVAPDSTSSSSSSSASDASSPADTPPGRQSLVGQGSSAGLAAGIRSLSMQLSSPSTSQGAASRAGLDSSSADSGVSRYVAQFVQRRLFPVAGLHCMGGRRFVIHALLPVLLIHDCCIETDLLLQSCAAAASKSFNHPLTPTAKALVVFH